MGLSSESSLSGQGVETSVNLEIDYPKQLSRPLLFVKWLFVIPALIGVVLYGIAVFITTFLSFWVILITGKYPSGLFDFAAGFMSFQARTYAYFPLLMTDVYPFDDKGDVRYKVERPEELSRLVLLLKLVNYLFDVVGTVIGMAILVLVLVSMLVWFPILFTGVYPRGLFDFQLAIAQWTARVSAWEFLMRDEKRLFATTTSIAYLVAVAIILAIILAVVYPPYSVA